MLKVSVFRHLGQFGRKFDYYFVAIYECIGFLSKGEMRFGQTLSYKRGIIMPPPQSLSPGTDTGF